MFLYFFFWISCLYFFLFPVFFIFCRFWLPTWLQNRPKIAPKIDLFVDPFFDKLLIWFWIDFWSIWDLPGNEKCAKTIGFCGSKRGCVFLCYDRSWDRFWIDFWSLLGSFLERFWDPNSIPKAIQNLIDFWMDFLMILAPFGGPSCGHVGDIFGKNGATRWGPRGFHVVLLFLFLSMFGFIFRLCVLLKHENIVFWIFSKF